MRYKEPFSLYPRKTKKGKTVFYYRFYDEEGNRTSGKSTGKTTKTEARNYVNDLIKNGMLHLKKDMSFKEYTKNWWDWDNCYYIKQQRSKGKQISRSYANISRGYLTNHISTYFQAKRLQSISARDIEKWLMKLYEDPKKNLSPKTINHCLTTLKIMLKEAHRLGYIPTNPAESISQFSEKPNRKDILSPDKVKELFDEQTIDGIWNGNIKHYTLNLLAASTGMRMGEIQALTVKAVHKEYVDVLQSWERKYGLKEPKYNSVRAVPFPTKTATYLKRLIKQNEYNEPDDFIFYGNDKTKPLRPKEISKGLYTALEKIGVKYEEGEKRTITFHSWRHFFNTYMREKISDYKLRTLTGHKSVEMSDHYTQFNISNYQDVKELQEGIF